MVLSGSLEGAGDEPVNGREEDEKVGQTALEKKPCYFLGLGSGCGGRHARARGEDGTGEVGMTRRKGQADLATCPYPPSSPLP